MTNLKDQVTNALDTAIFENNYIALLGMPDDEVVLDLMLYDADLEQASSDEVQRYVEAYRADYKDLSAAAWERDKAVVNDPATPTNRIAALVEKWGERGDYFLDVLLARSRK